jgi:hypothetical protein
MSAATNTGKNAPARTYRLPRAGGWGIAWKASAVLGGLGIVTSAIGASSDPHRFAFSWLFAFVCFLAIGLGALFFVLAQHLTGAGWGVTVRRTAEFFMAGLPVFAVLFVPIALQMDELYPWMHHWRQAQHAPPGSQGEGGDAHHASSEGILGASVARAQEGRAPDRDTAAAGRAPGGEPHAAQRDHAGDRAVTHRPGEPHTPEHAAHEEVIESKLGWLNQPFFLARAALYLLIWIVLSVFFFRRSVLQDASKDLALSKQMAKFAPAATFAFGLTLTFAAFDWMMSLEPTWFSTIFGVQYFAVGVVSSLATMIVVLYLLMRSGALGDAVHTEHFHDLGKLLFGFLVFWAYISFSQFMLIWYASIPEETTYYHLRWAGGWRTFSILMIVVHFVIPFFLILSRNIKRRVPILAFGAAWLLVTHVMESFWLVMPYVSPGELSMHWLDVAALFAVGGIYLSVVFLLMERFSLIPIGDPRLDRALHLQVS